MERETKNIAGFHFDSIDYWDVFRRVIAWRQAAESRLVTLVNPYSVLLGHRDPQMAQAIRSASLVLPDGIGIIYAARLLGCSNLSRVTGPELMLRLCEWGRITPLRHYFYGSTPTVVKQLVNRLETTYTGIQIAGFQSPPFRPLTSREDEEAVERINRTRPDVVWVGLGAPRQEKWMLRHHGRIRAAALIGVGAAFDFHSQNKPWAPEWMRRCGLEWAHRLWLEPRRMWRRNAANLLFLGRIFEQRLRTALPASAPCPPAPTPACATFRPEEVLLNT